MNFGKFCNHCGKIFYGERCSCQKNVKRKQYDNSFYHGKHWIQLSKFIKSRDYLQDRLVMYFRKIYSRNTTIPENEITRRLYYYCITPEGNARFYNDKLIVHHIIPRDEDASKQYDINNLITVSNNIHEYLHQLYKSGYKEEVQKLLQAAVEEMLP